MPIRETLCDLCGATFEARRSTARYCTGSCRARYSVQKRDVRAAMAFGLVTVRHG